MILESAKCFVGSEGNSNLSSAVISGDDGNEGDNINI